MTKILKYIFAIITTLSRPLALDREIHYSVEATFRRLITQHNTDNAYCFTVKISLLAIINLTI